MVAILEQVHVRGSRAGLCAGLWGLGQRRRWRRAAGRIRVRNSDREILAYLALGDAVCHGKGGVDGRRRVRIDLATRRGLRVRWIRILRVERFRAPPRRGLGGGGGSH